MSQKRVLLRVDEVGKLLGVERSRAYHLIRIGVLPHVRIGGSIRIPRAALEAWLNQQAERALAATRTSNVLDAAASGGGREPRTRGLRVRLVEALSHAADGFDSEAGALQESIYKGRAWEEDLYPIMARLQERAQEARVAVAAVPKMYDLNARAGGDGHAEDAALDSAAAADGLGEVPGA